MQLSNRKPAQVMSTFSLTGDLLGFLRCGLQYRYQRIGKLPSTRPVQLWFGQFIHGVLEEAYKQFKEDSSLHTFPWEADIIERVCNGVLDRLAVQGLTPDPDLKAIGYRRAGIAINELGPELFPIIVHAEVRLKGSREFPAGQIAEAHRLSEFNRYEIQGIVDVITHVKMTDPAFADNKIIKAVLESFEGDPPEEFEIILDYKGMRRPASKITSGLDFWAMYSWQVQTYAHLRNRQPGSLPVIGGILFYVNELSISADDLTDYKKQLAAGQTDVVPEPGSEDERKISAWSPSDPIPELSAEFRFNRAIRVIPVSAASIESSLEEFDKVVARIETCKGKEKLEGKILETWEKNSSEERTCTACDALKFCPEFIASP